MAKHLWIKTVTGDEYMHDNAIKMNEEALDNILMSFSTLRCIVLLNPTIFLPQMGNPRDCIPKPG